MSASGLEVVWKGLELISMVHYRSEMCVGK